MVKKKGVFNKNIGLLPLMYDLSKPTERITPPKHAAYADDLTGGGKIINLRSWFDKIVDHSSKYVTNTHSCYS